jgi:hypothetical protein
LFVGRIFNPSGEAGRIENPSYDGTKPLCILHCCFVYSITAICVRCIVPALRQLGQVAIKDGSASGELWQPSGFNMALVLGSGFNMALVLGSL